MMPACVPPIVIVGSSDDFSGTSSKVTFNAVDSVAAGVLLEPALQSGHHIEVLLNGNVVQHDTTDHMIFDVATIIEYLSTVTWLEPGDVIATGTPDGVGLGRKPPLWMKAGDKVEIELGKVGVLVNTIAKE